MSLTICVPIPSIQVQTYGAEKEPGTLNLHTDGWCILSPQHPGVQTYGADVELGTFNFVA